MVAEIDAAKADRETLRRVQTPQAFRYADILAAHRTWEGEPDAGDDAQVLVVHPVSRHGILLLHPVEIALHLADHAEPGGPETRIEQVVVLFRLVHRDVVPGVQARAQLVHVPQRAGGDLAAALEESRLPSERRSGSAVNVHLRRGLT